MNYESKTTATRKHFGGRKIFFIPIFSRVVARFIHTNHFGREEKIFLRNNLQSNGNAIRLSTHREHNLCTRAGIKRKAALEGGFFVVVVGREGKSKKPFMKLN